MKDPFSMGGGGDAGDNVRVVPMAFHTTWWWCVSVSLASGLPGHLLSKAVHQYECPACHKQARTALELDIPRLAWAFVKLKLRE